MSIKKIKAKMIVIPDLKHQLRDMAITDMDKFMKLTAIDQVQIFVCLEREKGLSLQQIANKLKIHGLAITRQSVGERCEKCKSIT